MDESSQVSTILEIAHVLFIDIVSYSLMSMQDQHKSIAQLQYSVRAACDYDKAVSKQELISLPTGDGVALVFFGNPEAPVRCALDLSRKGLQGANFKVRMGIHTGPVYRVKDINANKNVAGGGINVAQRVMDSGDGGHILVSKTVADTLAQLEQYKDALHDLGEVEVKHGVVLHLYNLCKTEFGNPNRPSKISKGEFRPGTIINGRYKILEEVGKGGFAAVFRSFDLLREKEVAFKLLPFSMADSRMSFYKESFEREIAISRKISHQNIVAILDSGQTDDLRPFLVMEMFGNSSLSELLRTRSSLTWTEVADIARQVCAALTEAHQAGIVHRDLKPENILVENRTGPGLEVKVIDFGISFVRLAALEHARSSVTRGGMIVPTVGYMSPEQFSGTIVDQRSDIFALGIIMYSAITGTLPFDGKTTPEVILSIMGKSPVAPHLRRPDLEIPLWFSSVVMKALEKNPNNRFQSGDEVRLEMQRHMA